ncbi:NAD(P)H oxidoreductase [Sediminibacillus albus]|uniref:Putative NADPH-quinone reductase (Modulator of drug activity B) n=1 Tax=Sediminibacillus albus TaxID=407036 RepID=A0A1G8X1V4_9BACI|nr:NAD(P)H oxidoreductase [Sediminibacillus albus]SDJ83730.1 Putative NADPH-quinone reductase (modulator of drug activity B) [Sediminibacillus albus]
MKVLTIVTHPRTDSLTFTAAQRFTEGLEAAGHTTETVDLYRIGFQPVLGEADEPDWSADSQHFSPEVEAEIERVKQYDGLAFVFPLWWWSMPAMLKGYIDRVWNYGFAYGPGRLEHERVLWLSLAGAPIERFEKRKYDQMMSHYFNIGLADYCGIKHSSFELFYKTIHPDRGHIEQLLNDAFDLGLNYAK